MKFSLRHVSLSLNEENEDDFFPKQCNFWNKNIFINNAFFFRRKMNLNGYVNIGDIISYLERTNSIYPGYFIIGGGINLEIYIPSEEFTKRNVNMIRIKGIIKIGNGVEKIDLELEINESWGLDLRDFLFYREMYIPHFVLKRKILNGRINMDDVRNATISIMNRIKGETNNYKLFDEYDSVNEEILIDNLLPYDFLKSKFLNDETQINMMTENNFYFTANKGKNKLTVSKSVDTIMIDGNRIYVYEWERAENNDWDKDILLEYIGESEIEFTNSEFKFAFFDEVNKRAGRNDTQILSLLFDEKLVSEEYDKLLGPESPGWVNSGNNDTEQIFDVVFENIEIKKTFNHVDNGLATVRFQFVVLDS
jgi:hypothetical protein